jgi:hypothetical protein
MISANPRDSGPTDAKVRTVQARWRAEREREQYDQASMYTYWQELSNHNSIPTNQDKGQHLPRSVPSNPKVGDLQKLICQLCPCLDARSEEEGEVERWTHSFLLGRISRTLRTCT